MHYPQRTEAAKILAEHYQKTFELTYNLWQERNKNFIILLLISGAATLIIYRTKAITKILAAIYGKLLTLEKDGAIAAVNTGFPYDILQTILLAVILYLLIQIYHRTSHINRCYGCLEKLEDNIRLHLNLDQSSSSFTREGDFNKQNRPELLKLTGLVYAMLLGALMLFVLGGGYIIKGADYPPKNIIDYVLILMICGYYTHYVGLIYVQSKRELVNLLRKLAAWWRHRGSEGNVFDNINRTFIIPGLLCGILPKSRFTSSLMAGNDLIRTSARYF